MQNSYDITIWVSFGVSLIFASMVWAGAYGFGSDFYVAYFMNNLAWGGWNDRLGWLISTLTIGGIHVGVFVVSFFLSLATGVLIREHISKGRNRFVLSFSLIMIIAIHTWPVIMSTSNAMRQGLAMSFAFLALVMFSRNLFGWMVFFLSIACFSHKSGVLFLGVILAAFFSRRTVVHSSVLHFFIGLAAFALFDFLLPFYSVREEGSRIISGDFRLPFLIISISYIAIATWKRRFLFGGYHLAIYYFSFIFPVFVLQGFNWEFERLGMMLLFPYILSLGDILERKSNTLYLYGSFLALLALTFSTGMYASLEV